MRGAISILIALIAVSSAVVTSHTETLVTETGVLVGYLSSHAQTPEEYVVSKFSNHDIVFIGEYHRIKHDVELIQKLIPLLYKAHVYNLGMEFGGHEYQDKVDQLITAKSYDENLARWLMFHFRVDWGFKEYEDIYRAAWQLNRSLPTGARKFRVVNLGYRTNWSALKERNPMTASDWDKVWWGAISTFTWLMSFSRNSSTTIRRP